MDYFDNITTPIESRIATGLARLATILRSQAWGSAGRSGLTPTQAEILALLNARQAPLRLSTIAEQLAITAATTSDAVTALVNKGLVEKNRAADDGRAIAVKLTLAGIEMVGRLTEQPELLTVAVKTLNHDEQIMLLRLIIKMIRALQVRRQIPVGRMCITCKYFEANRYASTETPHHCHLVNAPFGDRHLRVDCPEHEEAESTAQQRNWSTFAGV